MMLRLLAVLLLMAAGSAAAQESRGWNDSATVSLVRRAIAARRRAEPDSTLASYHTTAHGFVLFLAQVGGEGPLPPRLVKADELEVEVYWRAPGPSKQVIRGWRDGRWLPTDISYHRDHLGIVADNFGDRIRLGEGDEVLDVPHPLGPTALEDYEYRLTDSVKLRSRDTVRAVHELEVRPRAPDAPRIIGTLSLDALTGDLVRLRFSFTASAYLDPALENITVVLENVRVEDRWWLPYRQEIEIRRQVRWLEFPARSIIRGRWEVGEYELNAVVPRSVVVGPPIGGLREPSDSGVEWAGSLDSAVASVAAPVGREDLDLVRREIESITDQRLAAPLPALRPGITGVSDIVRVNRVQGLAIGAGLAFRPTDWLLLRPRFAVSTADGRLVGDLRLEADAGVATLAVTAGRTIRDIADRPIISGVINSITSQEGGKDHGDYALLDAATIELARPIGTTMRLSISGSWERSRSLDVVASPASGSYRANPALGVGDLYLARAGWSFRTAAPDRRGGVILELGVEGGGGDREYVRGTGLARWRGPLGPGVLDLEAQGGLGSEQLPAYRTVALGGWGTLPGEPFREWGGLRGGLARLEYRFGVPAPALPLGDFASTGRTAVVAPFVAAGTAGGDPQDPLPWRPSSGPRVVAGLALELLHQLLRVETGISLHSGEIGVSVDLVREWWGVL